jgi:hypothetical protein
MTGTTLTKRQLSFIETVGGHLQAVLAYGAVFISGVIIGFESSEYPIIWPVTTSYTGKGVTEPYTQILEIGVGILAVCIMLIIILEWVLYLHDQ